MVEYGNKQTDFKGNEMAIISNQPNKDYYEAYCTQMGNINIFKKPEFMLAFSEINRYRVS